MATDPSSDVTRMLREWSAGDPSAADRLLPVVYGELHRLAASYLRRERTGHTLQSTALVNEAWMRLADQSAPFPGVKIRGLLAVIRAATKHIIGGKP